MWFQLPTAFLQLQKNARTLLVYNSAKPGIS